jgi:predicted ATPase
MSLRDYPIRRLTEDPRNVLDRRIWPASLAPVAQVLDHGLDLTSATILVGENGSGKSTLVEAIALAYGRFRGDGLWVLDEPESALSFNGCLTLLAVLKDLLAAGHSQVIMSTHSPVLAALPGAQILEAGPWGLRPRAWSDLEMVTNMRSFLEAPERYLRHL